MYNSRAWYVTFYIDIYLPYKCPAILYIWVSYLSILLPSYLGSRTLDRPAISHNQSFPSNNGRLMVQDPIMKGIDMKCILFLWAEVSFISICFLYLYVCPEKDRQVFLSYNICFYGERDISFEYQFWITIDCIPARIYFCKEYSITFHIR